MAYYAKGDNASILADILLDLAFQEMAVVREWLSVARDSQWNYRSERLERGEQLPNGLDTVTASESLTRQLNHFQLICKQPHRMSLIFVRSIFMLQFCGAS